MQKQFRGIAQVDGDASGGISFTLYLQGEFSSYTLGDNEKLVITDFSLYDEAGGDFFFDWDADDDDDNDVEDIMWAGNLVAKGGVVQQLRTPFVGPAGITPKIYGSAGAGTQSRGIISGYILTA